MESQHRQETRTRKRALKLENAPVESAHPAPDTPPLPTMSGWHELTEEQYHSDPCPCPSLSSHVAIVPRHGL